MKRWSAVRYLLPVLVCLSGLICAVPVMADRAAEIQFMKAEGTVNVAGAGGRTLARYANMKLCSGYQIQTEEDGSAWIGMGEEEQIRLDAGSRLEVRTAGNVPEFLLDAGSLYFHMNGNREDGGAAVRTASAAVYVQNASGWIRMVDQRCTAVCLLEGTLRCSVTDPVTGQVKHAVVTAGQQAECIVCLQDQDGERCDILLRDYEAEEIEAFVLDELREDPAQLSRIADALGMDLSGRQDGAEQLLAAAKAEMAEAMKETAQKGQKYTGMKDPVWERDPAAVFTAKAGLEDSQEETSGLNVFGTARADASDAGNAFRIPEALQTPQTQQAMTPPVQVGMAEPGEESRPSNDASRKQQPSSSAPPAASEPEAPSAPSEPEAPSVPSEPETPSAPADPAPSEPETPSVPADPAPPEPEIPSVPVQGEPTENQGLVVDGIQIAKNGPDGVIEVREGGRITFSDASVTLYNEGIITNAGIIDGAVGNEAGGTLTSTGVISGQVHNAGGLMHMSGGTVAGLTQESGAVQVAGGTVTDGCTILGGSFQMTGGTIYAGSADAALEVNGTQETAGETRLGSSEHEQISVTGGTVSGNGTGKAAIRLENGKLLLAKEAVIKAQSALDTISGSDSGSWELWYESDAARSEVPNIYVTREDQRDKMMCLKSLEDDFPEAAKAEAGDILTLSRDVSYSGEVIDVTSGTKAAPVVLNLNGKSLALYNHNYKGVNTIRFLSEAVWRIEGGAIAASYSGEYSSSAKSSIKVENSSELVIADCIVNAGVCNGLSTYGSGRVEISNSVIEGNVTNASGDMEIAGSEIRRGVYNQGNMKIGSSFITADADSSGMPVIQNWSNAGNAETLSIMDSTIIMDWGRGISTKGSCEILNSVLKLQRTSSGNNKIANWGTCSLADIRLEGESISIENNTGCTMSLSNASSASGMIINKGDFTLSDTTIASIDQGEYGTIRVSNGTVTDGVTVSRGRFEMTDGILKAGSAEAALKVDGFQGTAVDKDNAPASAENANVCITGGTIAGDGGKPAVQIVNGKAWITEAVVIKAEDALETMQDAAGPAGSKWAVRYKDFDWRSNDAQPVIYTTRKDSDGLMRLQCLETDFSKAAQAENGDILTLSDDTVYDGDMVSVTGGTEESPVILNLNRKLLQVRGGIPLSSGTAWSVENGIITTAAEDCWGDVFWCEDQGADSFLSIDTVEILGNICADVRQLAITRSWVHGYTLAAAGRTTISASKLGDITMYSDSASISNQCEIEHIEFQGNSAEVSDSALETAVLYAGANVAVTGSSIGTLRGDGDTQPGQETVSISGSEIGSIQVKSENRGFTGALFEIADTVVEYCEISSSGTLNIRDSDIRNGFSVYNSGTLEMSNTTIERGRIVNGDSYHAGRCILTNCHMTVEQICSSWGAELCIDGGEYTEARSMQRTGDSAMICYYGNWDHRNPDSRIRIGGGAQLTVYDTKTLLKLDGGPASSPYCFEVRIEDCMLRSENGPVLAYEDPEYQDGLYNGYHIMIQEGAVLSSGCETGTVIMKRPGDPEREFGFCLNGGKIVNERQGFSVVVMDDHSIFGPVGTELKSEGGHPLGIWDGSDSVRPFIQNEEDAEETSDAEV